MHMYLCLLFSFRLYIRWHKLMSSFCTCNQHYLVYLLIIKHSIFQLLKYLLAGYVHTSTDVQ